MGTTPSTPPQPTSSPTSSTRRTGKKRKSKEPESPECSPSKLSKATTWRKEMDKKIESNDQLLKENQAEVKDKEMSILIHLGILGGHRRLKTINYAGKEASFASKKR